jgi:FlaA1/EpsC-like NDP-sugar epimerase
MTAQQIRIATTEVTSRAGLALKRELLTYASNLEPQMTAANKVVFTRPAQVVIDGMLVAVSLSAAYLLRFDAQLPAPYDRQLVEVLPFAIALSLTINGLTGLYRRVWRFFAMQDAAATAGAVTLMFLASVMWRIFEPGTFAGEPIPFGVLLIFPFFAFGTMITARVARRVVYSHAIALTQTRLPASRGKRLLLAGAGEAGLYLLRELRDSAEVVGFVDDDQELQGRTIGGCRVLGPTHALESIIADHRVDEVILCMPSAPKAVQQRIVERCLNMPVKTSTVPPLWEIMSGATPVAQLRPVNMEDLLGRRRINPPEDISELTDAYSERRIVVTGAGGSIGSELVRQLRGFRPCQLILVDKDENNLYEIACEIREDFDNIVEIVADVRNREGMQKLFELHQPEVVFHAAAYKHVPLMESFPAEAILNNVVGTRNVAELAHACNVKTFVFVSTDKAVNPWSMMGASKRVAEMIVQDLAARSEGTRFCCVRFGNVLGSRASVVPLFQRQIRQGRNITVTHPDVRRYFMTIPEAVQLVIQAGSLGDKGEIFLLDMGDPVKIVDLARNLIELSGLVPDKDVVIEFTGLRPGEKLHEELLIAGEQGVRSTKLSKIFVVAALTHDWSSLPKAVSELQRAAHADDRAAIHRILEELNIGYLHGRGPRDIPSQTGAEPARATKLAERSPSRRYPAPPHRVGV